MDVDLKVMTAADYDEAIALWLRAEGIGLSASDERAAIASFLDENPGLSFVARDGGVLVGTVLCGSDGRRGYIHHLAVAETHRRRGIGRVLVERALAGLRDLSIAKCHLFVAADNAGGLTFWRSLDWTERVDLVMLSRELME